MQTVIIAESGSSPLGLNFDADATTALLPVVLLGAVIGAFIFVVRPYLRKTSLKSLEDMRKALFQEAHDGSTGDRVVNLGARALYGLIGLVVAVVLILFTAYATSICNSQQAFVLGAFAPFAERKFIDEYLDSKMNLDDADD